MHSCEAFFFFNVFRKRGISKEELNGQKPNLPFPSQTQAGKQSKASVGPRGADPVHQPPLIPASQHPRWGHAAVWGLWPTSPPGVPCSPFLLSDGGGSWSGWGWLGISSSYQCGRIKPGNIPFFPRQSPWAHRGPCSHPYFTATTHHESGIHFPRLVTEEPSDDLYQHHYSEVTDAASHYPFFMEASMGTQRSWNPIPFFCNQVLWASTPLPPGWGPTGPEKRVTYPPCPSSCFTRGWPEGKTKRDRRRRC